MNPFAVLTAASAIALASAVAYAQPAPSTPTGDQARGAPMMTRADLDSLTDARIAGIQAGLKLTADQQKLWPPVEQALRDQAAGRAQRMEEFRARRGERRERPDMMTMLERRSAFETQQADGLKKLTDALKPLWASLDDNQKKLLPILMRPAAGSRMRQHRSGPSVLPKDQVIRLAERRRRPHYGHPYTKALCL